jgi:general secretion pathway protein K
MAATGAVASEPWLFEGHAVRVAASVERGKVDLNLAPPELLALAAGLAGDPEPSRFAAGALAARRAHAAAGVSWRLGARPFHGVDEARALVSEAVWPGLAPLLTVHGAAAPDPALAPAPLRAALDAAGAAQADLVAGDVIALSAAAEAPDGARAALDALIRLEEGGGFAALAWRDSRP